MPDQPRPLILASQSPQRRALLAEAGYAFEIIAPDASVECGMCSGESPADTVLRLAREKAADVATHLAQGVVIGCDTICELDGRALGKPANEEHARRMLCALRGREHRVLSGLCLRVAPAGPVDVRLAVTRLQMEMLTDAALEEYLASGLWEGKAGAFGYQDRLGWIRVVEGSESNVVGLPMELLAEMLRACGDGSLAE